MRIFKIFLGSYFLNMVLDHTSLMCNRCIQNPLLWLHGAFNKQNSVYSMTEITHEFFQPTIKSFVFASTCNIWILSLLMMNSDFKKAPCNLNQYMRMYLILLSMQIRITFISQFSVMRLTKFSDINLKIVYASIFWYTHSMLKHWHILKIRYIPFYTKSSPLTVFSGFLTSPKCSIYYRLYERILSIDSQSSSGEISNITYPTSPQFQLKHSYTEMESHPIMKFTSTFAHSLSH